MSRGSILLATLLALLALANPGAAQDYPVMPTVGAPGIPASPTPIATQSIPVEAILDPEDVPHSEIYNFLATAVANVNALPDDLSRPNGTSLIPNETATQLFGYAKWLFSLTTAQELLGDTLAPIGINLYLYLTATVALTIVWVTVRIAVLIIRFVQHAAKWILEILPF